MEKLFHIRLKEQRLQNKLSQRAIADKLNISHVSYLRWEQGKTEPCIRDILILCDLFCISADYLLGRENEDGTIGN